MNSNFLNLRELAIASTAGNGNQSKFSKFRSRSLCGRTTRRKVGFPVTARETLQKRHGLCSELTKTVALIETLAAGAVG